MAKIILQPYAAIPKNATELGKNPKDWPYFNELVAAMPEHEFVQIGFGDKPIVGAEQFVGTRNDILRLLRDADTFVCVDTWLQHLATLHAAKRGVVIFTRSQPYMFGHRSNINLLKSYMYVLSPYIRWDAIDYTSAAFIGVDKVIQAIKEVLDDTEG
jgi:hypothetical protein